MVGKPLGCSPIQTRGVRCLKALEPPLQFCAYHWYTTLAELLSHMRVYGILLFSSLSIPNSSPKSSPASPPLPPSGSSPWHLTAASPCLVKPFPSRRALPSDPPERARQPKRPTSAGDRHGWWGESSREPLVLRR